MPLEGEVQANLALFVTPLKGAGNSEAQEGFKPLLSLWCGEA